MGLVSRLLTKGAPEPDLWKDPRAWTDYNSVSTNAGIPVSVNSALTCSAVYACVRLLAETIASLPLHVYHRLPRGKERAADHPLYELLHDRPNPLMTSFGFRETLQAHVDLRGNAFALIDKIGKRPIALWPLNPDRMTVDPGPAGRPEYHYQPKSGGLEVFAPEEILHIRGLADDGLIGYSPLRVAREAIGLALAAQEMGARLFSNGAVFRGILESPKPLGDEAAKRLTESINAASQGVGRSHKFIVLEEGVTWKQIGIAPEDAQFLETRRFQVAEIAGRIFGIPPHMIGDTERSTSWGTGIEQQGIGFVVYTQRPRLVRWESELSLKLLTPEERREFFVEFAVDGLLRGDIKSRYASYAAGRQWGWLSVNDIRELENMNPVDGGDTYLQPTNMVPAGTPPALSLDEPKKGDDKDE